MEAPTVSFFVEQFVDILVHGGGHGQGSTVQVEYISSAPGFRLPAAVVESIASVPAGFQSPAPVVEYISPAPAVFPSTALRRDRGPGEGHQDFSRNIVQRRFLEQNTDMELSRVYAEVEDLLEVLNALSQERVHQLVVETRKRRLLTITLWMLKDGVDYAVVAFQHAPLRRVFQAYCSRLGPQASQVCFFFG